MNPTTGRVTIGQHGGIMLDFNGYMYRLGPRYATHYYWRCQYQCGASLNTVPGELGEGSQARILRNNGVAHTCAGEGAGARSA